MRLLEELSTAGVAAADRLPAKIRVQLLQIIREAAGEKK